MFGKAQSTTSGGRGSLSSSPLSMDIRRVDSIKVNGENVGNRVRVKVVKNKAAPTFKVAGVTLGYGQHL